MTKHALLLALLAACFLSVSCQKTSNEPAVADPEPAAEEEAEAVEFEPAYPADVSTAGLSDEDVAQQPTEHSHDGGEAHSHEEEHGHDDPEEQGDDDGGTHDDHDH